MEKLKSLQINFALVALICFTIKTLLFSPSYPDSIILLGLGCLYGYTQYLKRFQPYKLDDAVAKDLLEVKSALTKLNLARVNDKASERRYF